MTQKIVNKIIDLLVVSSVIFLIIYSGYTYMVSENSNNTYLLGLKPILIGSDQMEPSLKKNSIAIAKKTKNIKKGDIVVYINQEKINTHILEDIKEDGTTVTRSEKIKDPYKMKLDEIDGKVIFKINLFNDVISSIQENVYIGIAFLISRILLIIFLILFLKEILIYLLMKYEILVYDEQ